MSWNAIVRGLSRTRVAGISPAAMPQNKQSATRKILTVAPPNGSTTYMVAVLRTPGAPPLGVHGPASAELPCHHNSSRSGGRGMRTPYGMGVGAVGSFKLRGAWWPGVKIRHDDR